VVTTPRPSDEPTVAGSPVPIELQFVGVGDLHQRWFGDTSIATDLSAALGTCMTDRAVIQISYDEDERIGRIRLYLDGDHSTCKPAIIDSSVELTPVQPLGEALARYRDAVAGRFDLRVSSFRIEIEMLAGTHGCVLHLGGQYPPDGSTWSSCVELGGEDVCVGPRDEGTALLRFPQQDHARYLAACFDLG